MRAAVEDLQGGDLVLVLRAMNCSKVSTILRARSRAASEKPASSTGPA